MSYYDNSAVARAIADTSDYITRRYGSNRNRHWWGIAHRSWLLSSGRYVYTTRPSERAMRRTKTGIANLIVGEGGPELISLRHSTQ